jgi:hypothetical protein
MSRSRIAVAVLLTISIVSVAGAQFFGGQNLDVSQTEFVFARWAYNSGRGWDHDYPHAEEHINAILSEATELDVDELSYRIVPIDSEDIFRYPFGYISEPGSMSLSDAEVANFREFVDRGGFVMLDDFDGPTHFARMKMNMDRVFPDRPLVRMKGDHPILRTFYQIEALHIESPYNVGAPAEFWGIFGEKGDLQVIVCFNNDVGDYWEKIDQPTYKLRPSAEALRLGVNFVLYAMTH